MPHYQSLVLNSPFTLKKMDIAAAYSAGFNADQNLITADFRLL